MAKTSTTTPDAGKEALPPQPVEATTTITDKATGKVVNAPPPPNPKVEAPAPTDKITFEMYCGLKNVLPQRRAGMRAITKAKYETLASWEQIFKSY